MPRVLGWCGDAGNPVESEYILMEEADGEQLGEVWGEMGISDKLKIVDEIVAIEKKFLSVSFTRSVLLDWCTRIDIANKPPTGMATSTSQPTHSQAANQPKSPATYPNP